MRIFRFLSAVLIVLAIAACATRPSLKEPAAAVPALEKGQARIYFYRTSAAGGASEPTVLLNGQKVEDATPRSVFFRDVAPGKYSVTTTMSSRVVSFDVAAGDKKYVKLVYGSSFNTYPELVDSATGEAESSGLSSQKLAGMPLRRVELKVGEIYYVLQYRNTKSGPPLISSYEYRGTVDGKPNAHFFKAAGLSDADVFLEEAQLNSMVDFNGLKEAIR